MDDADRSIEFTWTRREFARVTRVVSRPLLWLLLPVVVVALAGLVEYGFDARLAAAALLLLLFAALPQVVAHLQWPRLAAMREVRVTWAPDEIGFRSSQGSGSYRPGSLRDVRVASGFVVIEPRAGSAIAVPARAFASDDDRAHFVQCAEALVEPGSRASGRWVRMARIPVLVVVAGLLGAMVVTEPSGPAARAGGGAAALAEAQETWRDHGPDEYDLGYRIAFGDGQAQQCVVTVRRGVVTDVAGVGGDECADPSTMEDLHDFVLGALLRVPEGVGTLTFDEATGALAAFSVDEDGTPTGRWSISVTYLQPL